jgi:hypothetical protein
LITIVDSKGKIALKRTVLTRSSYGEIHGTVIVQPPLGGINVSGCWSIQDALGERMAPTK